MKKIWLLTTLLVAGLLLTGCNKTCTDDCLPEDWENNNQIQCGNVYDPICWEDWKVYSNWCYLNVAGAHWDETLWVKNDECFKITKESLYWKYILTRYNDNHNVRDNHNIELNISADWIFAKFCNHLGTSNYSLSWNILTVEEMSQTEMACEWENWEWLMNAESEFNLNDARVTLSEDNLTISTSRWAQYQFQISDDYNQFLEAIKSSWEQPQWKNNNIPSFDELEDVVAMCPYETLWWWYDEYPVYKREFILPYKDWYVWYNYGWNNWEWWGYYLTYKSIDNPCEIISASDEFFFRYFNDRTRYINPEEPIRADNKVFLWLGWIALDVVEKELDCEMWKDINDDDTCQKEMNKYMYNLVIWKEKNDTFTKWMNYLKKSIDTNNYTTPYTWNDIEVSCYENNTWLDFLNEYWEDNKKLTEEKRKEYRNIRNKRIRECIDNFIK